MNSMDNEIDSFDFLIKLRDGWRWILGGGLLGLVVAAAVVAVVPVRYEALAIVQLGTVAGTPLEEAGEAVERMKSPAFQLRVAKQIGDKEWVDCLQESSVKTKNLSLAVLKSASNLIELRARGETPQAALRKANAMVAQLAAVHGEQAKPATQKIQQELALAKDKLASAERDMKELGEKVASAVIKDDRFTQLSLMTSVRLQKEADVYGQRKAIMALETSLLAPATRPTQMLEPAFAPEERILPKTGLSLGLGCLAGLCLGALTSFVWNALRTRNT